MEQGEVKDGAGATEEKKQPPPTDRNARVYWIVFYTGLVMLLPWNILITVNGYWDYKFRNTTLDGVELEEPPPLTREQKEFTAYLSIAANVPNATFIILHAFVGHKFDMSKRLIGSQLAGILVFSVIVVLSIVDSDEWQHTFLIVNLVTIVLINIVSAVFQGSVSALLGTFPMRYIGHYVTGAGMGGLVPALVNVVILAINADFQTAGFYCFLFAEATAIVCLGLIVYLIRGEPFYHHYASIAEDKDRRTFSKLSLEQDLRTYLEVLSGCWIYLLATVINFATTLVVFPAITVLIEPQDYQEGKWHDVFFVAVICFVAYNTGDVVGKDLAKRLRWPGQPEPHRRGRDGGIVLALSSARVVLIPLIMYCNVAPNDRNTEVLFDSEWYFLTFNVLLAVTNGYVGNLCSMFCPKAVREELQDISSAFTTAAVVIGIGIGSLLSAPVVRLL